jgi:hypothetical protein
VFARAHFPKFTLLCDIDNREIKVLDLISNWSNVFFIDVIECDLLGLKLVTVFFSLQIERRTVTSGASARRVLACLQTKPKCCLVLDF